MKNSTPVRREKGWFTVTEKGNGQRHAMTGVLLTPGSQVFIDKQTAADSDFFEPCETPPAAAQSQSKTEKQKKATGKPGADGGDK